MKNYFCVDYATYILFKFFGAVIRRLPLYFSLFFGRRLGDIVYLFDLRHKSLVHAHLRRVFQHNILPGDIKRLTKGFYRNFGQSLIEIFLIPRIDKDYLQRYITIEGREYIEEAFARGKGVIFCGIHEGSWELYNIITANLGFPFHFMVGELGDRFAKVVALLNEYRRQKGCRLIYRGGSSDDGVRRLIRVLRANEAVGMSIDQGGRSGVNVPFFGRDASMSTGAVRLALKYDAAIVPSFIYRRGGPYNTVILKPPFDLIKSDDPARDLQVNLQRLTAIFEKHIMVHPQEYLWTYKVWKYSRRRTILIVDDSRAGHLRQAQAVARLAQEEYHRRSLSVEVKTVAVEFQSRLRRSLLEVCTVFTGRWACQGCAWCLRSLLRSQSYTALTRIDCDLVISCGASTAHVNYVISRQNNSRSVVLMDPGIFSRRKFDLVIMPRHDRSGTAGKNVVRTEGALNLIDEEYLRVQVSELIEQSAGALDASGRYVGVLLGGDAKRFHLDPEQVHCVLRELKIFCEEADARLLLTTSRRTPALVENVVRAELQNQERCALCLIANERNIPSAVGGIIGLSSIILCSAESISMISEAAASGKYVVVFGQERVSPKHRRFLKDAAEAQKIYLAEPGLLKDLFLRLIAEKPPVRTMDNNRLITQALGRIL